MSNFRWKQALNRGCVAIVDISYRRDLVIDCRVRWLRKIEWEKDCYAGMTEKIWQIVGEGLAPPFLCYGENGDGILRYFCGN